MNLLFLLLFFDNLVSSLAKGVTVTPSVLRIPGQGVQQFQAIVRGTGNINQAGVWSISAGSITQKGVATMPAATGADQTVTVTFTATQNGVVGTATVTVPMSASENYFSPLTLPGMIGPWEDVVPDVAIANSQAMVGLMVGSAGRVLVASRDGIDRAFLCASPGALIPGQFSIMRNTGTSATAVRAAYRAL